MPKKVKTRTQKLSSAKSFHVPRQKALFHVGQKIPEPYHQAFMHKLLRLRPSVRRIGRYYQASDIFKNLYTEPHRIKVKKKLDYLYPDAIGKTFSQTYRGFEVQKVQETIVLYLNAFFFSEVFDPTIDLTHLDGENIFTGKVDLFLKTLKKALRSLFSRLSSNPQGQHHSSSASALPQDQSSCDWGPDSNVLVSQPSCPVRGLGLSSHSDFVPHPSTSGCCVNLMPPPKLPPEHHRPPHSFSNISRQILCQDSTPSELISVCPESQLLPMPENSDQEITDDLLDFLMNMFDVDGSQSDFTHRVSGCFNGTP
jgi:hypothetical protein